MASSSRRQSQVKSGKEKKRRESSNELNSETKQSAVVGIGDNTDDPSGHHDKADRSQAVVNHVTVRSKPIVDVINPLIDKMNDAPNQAIIGSSDSIRDASIVCNGNQGDSPFRNSPSDASLVTKTSVLSVDSIVSASDCELKILKRSSKEENTISLSPVSEV